LDVLAATLKSPDPWLRHSAARGLGFDKSNRSVQLLVGALGDRSDFVRDGIVEVLQKATGEKLGPDVVKWREYASKLHSDQAGKPVEASARGQGGTTKEPPRPRGATREYQDAANGLSLQYPAAWKEMGPAEARQIMGAATSRYLTVVIYDPTDRTQNINVQVAPVDAKDLTEASYREFAKQMDQSMPSGFAGFRKISSQVAPLLDMASLQYVFEFTRPDGVLLRQKQLRTGKPGREVSITMTAKADLYEKTDAACFKTIVDTLKLK
jgi:hypothetical protein